MTRKFKIKAFGDDEIGLKTQYAIVTAKDKEAALAIAWEKFPEYEDVYVSEYEEVHK